MIERPTVASNWIVVDTDVFSYAFKKDTRAEFFRPHLMHKTLALSFMSVAQLHFGAYKAGWGEDRLNRLERELKKYVVLPFDYRICQRWGRLRVEMETKGLPMSESDLWVAASALEKACALATNNGKHFQNVDNLDVVCPELN